MRVIKKPTRSPRANAFTARFVRTLRRERLDHLPIHGERHLRKALTSYEHHFNHHRPHQGRSFRLPLHDPSEVMININHPDPPPKGRYRTDRRVPQSNLTTQQTPSSATVSAFRHRTGVQPFGDLEVGAHLYRIFPELEITSRSGLRGALSRPDGQSA
ncbi:integrase core domain-containing protein [Nonomuraea sp. NPDC050451]|uniref:integrase core domain-containing protein n=1 Tax=Nonomuraea sp. NPDC050451 TaxID=3364364 RepID=UPI0037B4DD3F